MSNKLFAMLYQANCDTQWKFSLTNSMIWPMLHWFNAMLGHPGFWCMCAMLQAKYHHPHLCMHIEQFACDKPFWPQPWSDWDIAGALWEEVAVDLISPWPASTPETIYPIPMISQIQNFMLLRNGGMEICAMLFMTTALSPNKTDPLVISEGSSEGWCIDSLFI